jgi:hypothetical protein
MPAVKYIKKASKNPVGLVALVLLALAIGYFVISARAASSADINHDNKVDVFDLSILLGQWGQTGAGKTADLNGDSAVTITDLSILLSQWGAVVATSPSSTPATERWSTLHPFLSSAFSNTSVGSGIITDPNSPMTATIKQYTTHINSANWSFPVIEASASDPQWTITDSNGTTFTLRIPNSAAPSPGTDAHISLTQPDKRTHYEMWRASKDASGWHAEFIVQTDLLSTGMSNGARASAISHLHGLIRTEEVANLKIPHTLAMGIEYEQLKSGYVWPAKNQDWNGASVYTGTIPMGTMFVIPMSVNIDSLGLTPEGRALAWTLQNYGAHVLLSSGNVTLYAETEVEAQHSAALNKMRTAWAVLRNHLQVVTNNTSTNIAGGGTRAQPPLPEVVAK